MSKAKKLDRLLIIMISKFSFAIIWNFKDIAYPYLSTDIKNAHNVCKTQSIENDYPEFTIIFKPDLFCL